MVSLLFRTRFTKFYLASLAFVAFLDLSPALFGTPTSFIGTAKGVESGYLGFFLLLFVLMSTITGGGLPFSKADQDILLMLPVPKRALATSVIMVQFFSVGILFFVLSIGAIVTVSQNYLHMAAVAIDSFALGLLSTTIPLSTYKSSTGVRITVAMIFAAFVLVSFINFPVSLLAPYYGHYVNGTILIFSVLAVSLYFSVKNITEGVEVRSPKFRGTGSSSYRTGYRGFGNSPEMAVFTYNFRMISVGGQSTGPVRSGRSSFSTRLRLGTAVLILAIIAVAFGVLDQIFILRPSGAEFNSYLSYLFLFYIVLFPLSFFFSSTVLIERLWISLLAMSARKYFTIVLAARIFQSLILELPLVAVTIVLSMLHHSSIIGYLIIFTILVPLYTCSLIIFSTLSKPVQITDAMSPQGRIGVRNFILVIPTLIFAIGYFMAVVFPIYSLVPCAILGSFVAYSGVSHNFWGKTVGKLVENGFV
ncbi:MAG: hypothetical protein QW812_02090 [Thermoplasmataceae archaeon]